MSLIDWQALRQQLAETEAWLAEKASRDPDNWSELMLRRSQQLQQRQTHSRVATQDYLVLSLGLEDVLVPVQDLRAIEAFDCCEPLALATPELLGICHARGRMVSVVELARLLGAPPPAEPGYVLFMRTQPELGLRVARLIEIVALTPESLSPAPEAGYYSGFEPAGRPVLELRSLLQHPFLASTHFSKELTP